MSETTQGDLTINVTKLSPEDAVAKLLQHALEVGASDLFFHNEEGEVTVEVRHLGAIRPISRLPLEMGRRCIAQIKARASMDITEKRRPLDGRWIFRTGSGERRVVDLRINSLPTLYGEDLALRLLDRGTRLFVVDNLGMHEQQHNEYNAMIASSGGLVLISGPTGSGKTASLYASLISLNNGTRKICTIEDPVEFSIDGLRQSQINTMINLGFAELLRSVLRQSPDIIMIGEIRDELTAQIAVRAANSGHLVFATLHAPTAAGAIQSMRAMGAHNHFLASALRGCVSQRLVRKLCEHCRVPIDLSMAPHTFDEIRHLLGPDEGKQLWAPKGCDKCRMIGYNDRTAVFEVMPMTREVRQMVSDGAPTRDIRTQAMEQGMLSFRHAAMLHVARGVTSTEEVIRVIPPEHLEDEVEPEPTA